MEFDPHDPNKRMKESLRLAADIREELDGRHHSDSTELVTEDRRSSLPQKPQLEDLIADVTAENKHEELDFGPPVGKEEW